MHLIGVTERPGVRLPASPPHWASTSRWTEARKCCKTAANYPSSPPPIRPNKARHALLHCAYPSLLCKGNVLKRRDELYLRHFHCAQDPNLSLRDHSDVHNRKTAPAAPPSSGRTQQQACHHRVRELQLWNATVFCTSGPPLSERKGHCGISNLLQSLHCANLSLLTNRDNHEGDLGKRVHLHVENV